MIISLSSVFRSFGIVALCLLNNHVVNAQFGLPCNTSPDALTRGLQATVPQTCIEVPDSDGETRTRCYYTYVPPCSVTEPTPLVIDVHGAGSCPLWSGLYTGWLEKAKEECFVVVWPVGTPLDDGGACFQAPGFLKSEDKGTMGGNNVTTNPCCCGRLEDNDEKAFRQRKVPDDPLFIKMIIENTIESLSASSDQNSITVDPNRVYMTGHSNGCIMSLAMAALYPESIAAVCCHAGALVTPFPDPGYSPVPIWMVHGMMDETIEYNGEVNVDIPSGQYGLWSLDQTMNYLAKQNGCSGDQVITTDVWGEDESGNTTMVGEVFQRTECKADVELVALFESGHMPYKMASPLFQGIVTGWGESLTTVDTTAMAWEFCSAHSKKDVVAPVVQEDVSDEVENNGDTEEEEEVTPASELAVASAKKEQSFGWYLGALLLSVPTILSYL